MILDASRLTIDTEAFTGFVTQGEDKGDYVLGRLLTSDAALGEADPLYLELEFASRSEERGTDRDPWITFDLRTSKGRAAVDSYRIELAPPELADLIRSALFGADGLMVAGGHSFRQPDAFVATLTSLVSDAAELGALSTIGDLFSLIDRTNLTIDIGQLFEVSNDPWRRWRDYRARNMS